MCPLHHDNDNDDDHHHHKQHQQKYVNIMRIFIILLFNWKITKKNIVLILYRPFLIFSRKTRP